MAALRQNTLKRTREPTTPRKKRPPAYLNSFSDEKWHLNLLGDEKKNREKRRRI